MKPVLTFLLGWWGMTGLGAEPVAVPAPITSCAEIRALSREVAARGLPVQVRGVVTLIPFQTANHFTFTVDDGTGIWVSPARPDETADLPGQLRVGDLVEVSGRTLDGRFSPTIAGLKVRVLGRGALPVARAVTALGLGSGQYDSQRVTIDGVVQAAEASGSGNHRELRLQVRSAMGLFNYILLDGVGPSLDTLVNSEVSLTGVCLSYFNSRRQFLGARIYSNDATDLRVLKPGESDAFSVPAVALRDVLAFTPADTDLHRWRVRGTVILSNPGRYFFLQDGTAALRVNTRQVMALKPGDIVEAAGFFHLGHHRAEMQEAVFRLVGHGPQLQPEEITHERAFVREPQTVYAVPQDYDDRLVAMRGELLSLEDRRGEPLRLNLMCDGILVPAEFPDPTSRDFLATLRAGSKLRVTGVCQLTFSASRPVVEWPQPIALRLLVRGPGDVEVLRAASYWTPQRLSATLATLLVVLAAALAWVVLLRQQIAQRSQELAEEMRARRDSAVEFESATRERNRLAADLHDTMEQSLTGMAFQIEAGQALLSSNPEQSQQHLGLARQLLARSREDLRRSIWNLRANPLERQTLVEALREVAADRSVGLGVTISVHCEGEQRPLADFVAANMLLLAQEGITNALKHAEATSIQLGLVFSPGTITLTIEDNGKGFDQIMEAGSKTGHYGLQGMRERVKRLGGKLTLKSAPGVGTTIMATVAD